MSPNTNKLNTISTYTMIVANHDIDEYRNGEDFNNNNVGAANGMISGGNDNRAMGSNPLVTDVFARSLPPPPTTTMSLSSLLFSANHTRLSMSTCVCSIGSDGGDKSSCFCLFPLSGEQQHRGKRRRLIDTIDEAIRIIDGCPLDMLDGKVTTEVVENNRTSTSMHSTICADDNTVISSSHKRRKLPQ